ncbi:MAG: yjbN [Alphaproteobacteria bacterium]|nr:yjbN [Alphaproteobacteria bacterium]
MSVDRRISVAPMMDWTDRHCRFFHRLLSPNALLYSEMIHANAIVLGDARRHLYFRAEEHPVALQLGGIDSVALAKAARIGQEFGYNEINLNCGCPSDRVQAGAFGACLMAEPLRVAQAVAAMRDVVQIPVTVKTRIGIDNQDSYEFLCDFIETVHEKGGCDVFILHARKAWLKGLSPKENREKPPLDWTRVHQIKRDYPQLEIIINGGFENMADIGAQFAHVNGVMIGRKAYHEPYFLAEMERAVFASMEAAQMPHHLSRETIVAQMLAYMREEQAKDIYLKNITRHMLGLYHAQPVSKKWKNALMDAAKENSVRAIEDFLA